jgi:IS5 family transposase
MAEITPRYGEYYSGMAKTPRRTVSSGGAVRTLGREPYYQYFCGEEFFQHRLVFDRSSLTRWRNWMGEERLQALIQESLSVATKTEAIKPSELSRVIVDTTVQPKNVTFPTNAKLRNRAREKLVRLTKRHGVDLRQSYARVGKFALIQHQRYAHAKQFKRANRMLKKLRTYLGRVIRDIARKIEGNSGLEVAFAPLLLLARRVREQKLFSLSQIASQNSFDFLLIKFKHG